MREEGWKNWRDGIRSNPSLPAFKQAWELTLGHFKVNQKDIFFILKDQLDYGSLCALERYGACQAFNMAPSLTHGAAHLIESFGNEEQKRRFVPRMYDGTWSRTTCLTESDAGSNLAAIQTTAYPQGDHYRIKGSKTFISWGDHDLTENIIHLLLARSDGAPPGVKGISLFIVPKMRVDADGSLAEPNDVICIGVEAKLGLHASPTCSLSFGSKDGCIGYLCGQANNGLSHMFQMMNAARINTGVSGMTLASTAYQNALDYAKSRIQGRDVSGRKSGEVVIIEHPDIRRMLLWMKAMVDGMRSMIYTGAFWQDLSLELPDGEKKRHYQNLVDFMTPIIKAYCSDMGFRVCETAIQCLGGYGYCREYPLEQYLRDAKIMSLYEGTNGIQSMDLCRSLADYPELPLEGCRRVAILTMSGAAGILSADFMLRFLAIHPFQDGNGRLARILTNLMLLRGGYDFVQYSSHERIVEANKDQYYLALRESQKNLILDENFSMTWAEFFLEMLRKQKNHLLAKIERERKARTLPELSVRILHLAREHGRIGISFISNVLQANRNTVKKHVQQLVKSKRLVKQGKGRGTFYIPKVKEECEWAEMISPLL